MHLASNGEFDDPVDIIGKDDYGMGWHDESQLYRRDDNEVIEYRSPKLLIEEVQSTPDGNTITLIENNGGTVCRK